MIQNKNVLKSFFETGDKPSQQNYFDLIDSLLPMIGEVRATSFAFAPQGWKKCNGELLAPSAFPELFALIGTTYGGDGVDTFALPNLCGRIPLGYGATAGLSAYTIGQTGGEETHQLTTDEMPVHEHNFSPQYNIDAAQNETPQNGDVPATSNFPGSLGAQNVKSFGPPTITVNGLESNTTSTGSGQPHNIIQPYLALNYIIAVEGFNPL